MEEGTSDVEKVASEAEKGDSDWLWAHFEYCGCIIQDCRCICTRKDIKLHKDIKIKWREAEVEAKASKVKTCLHEANLKANVGLVPNPEREMLIFDNTMNNCNVKINDIFFEGELFHALE